MNFFFCTLLHSYWNTEDIWWILGCASHCGLEAKKSFSWPVVIHHGGVVWGVEIEVMLNAAYIPEIWHVSMCCAVFIFSCPEGETHQSDVRVNTEKWCFRNQITMQLWQRRAHRITDANTHWSTYTHTLLPSSKSYCKQKRCLKAQIMMWKAQIYSIHILICIFTAYMYRPAQNGHI